MSKCKKLVPAILNVPHRVPIPKKDFYHEAHEDHEESTGYKKCLRVPRGEYLSTFRTAELVPPDLVDNDPGQAHEKYTPPGIDR